MKNCPFCKKKTSKFISNMFDDRYGLKKLFTLSKCHNCNHKFLLHKLSTKDLQNLYSKFYPRSSFTIFDLIVNILHINMYQKMLKLLILVVVLEDLLGIIKVEVVRRMVLKQIQI
jgi:hypothetical protein